MEPKDWLAIDPLLMDRTRLAILATLVREDEPIAFGALLERLDLTRGNLSVHARKLEEAGLIGIEKKFLDRRPLTSFAVTAQGRKAMENYLGQIEKLLANSLQKQ